jgi:MoxR-like ATPase
MASAAAKTAPNEPLRPLAVPIGHRLERVLAVAYKARRAVLLEGPTGVGKSEIVRRVAETLSIDTVVLDLSLLEPPDLVGLPVVKDGRTEYALPHVLPKGGAGLLLLEELNRAERYIQQPALQLLSARRLHEYELPPGWVCIATVNPQTAEYHVTALDKALRARFLQVSVRADRASWLAWAQTQNLHPGVLALVRAHERAFDDVPPRTWTYAADLLRAFSPEELEDGALLRDALGGYLPAAWVEALLATKSAWSTGGQAADAIDVRELLATYRGGSPLAKKIASYRERGQTDRLDEIVHRLVPLLAGPEAGVLAAQKLFTLASFEALLGDLPGDQREKLQEALGGNATAVTLVDVDPTDFLASFAGGAAEKKIASWRSDPLKRHRVSLAVTALCAFLVDPSRLAELKRSNVARTCLGQLLLRLPERDALALVDTLKRIGITPIRPGS